MKKQITILLIVVGMLIGAGGCKESKNNREENQLPSGAPAPAVPFVPVVNDVKGPRYYEIEQEKEREKEIREHDEALAEAKRKFDKRLADQARIKREKEARVKREKEISDKLVVNQSMFGIFLGETIDSLRKRHSVTPSSFSFEEKDHPGVIWNVFNCNTSVKHLLVYTFEGKIYSIDVRFTDGSKTNYEAIKTQLEKKYRDTDDSLFGGLFGELSITTTIGTVKVYINLNHDIGFMEDDKLVLTYQHGSLVQQVVKEIHKRKVGKIGNEL